MTVPNPLRIFQQPARSRFDSSTFAGLAFDFFARRFAMYEPAIIDYEFYAALGRVIYTSSRMFLAIERLIMGMMSKSEGGAVLTVDLSFAQICHLANALADRMVNPTTSKPSKP